MTEDDLAILLAQINLRLTKLEAVTNSLLKGGTYTLEALALVHGDMETHVSQLKSSIEMLESWIGVPSAGNN